MTLRDYFAAKALAGTLAGDLNPAGPWQKIKALFGFSHELRGASRDSVAVRAYEVADAMLAERAKRMENDDE